MASSAAARVLILATCCALLASCGSRDASIDAKVEEVTKQVAEIKKNLEISNDRSDELAQRIQDQGRRHPEITSSSEGYQYLDTPIGVFLVALEGIEQIGAGTRINLLLANTTSTTVIGLDGRAHWSVAGEEKLRSKSFSFVETFKPGNWTRVRVTLDETSPDKFKSMVLIEPKLRSISMMQAQ